SPGGSEQHLTRAAAAARTRTQRPGKHLAVHASELVVKPDFQILRRYRRSLLLRLEHTHRPTLEDYVHRATRLGSSRSLNLRIGITRAAAAARNRTQRPGKHLAVHASELVVKPDFQILRRYRRPLLLRLEHTHRPTLEDYVHRATRLGSSRSLNLRIGIRRR